VIKTPAMLIRGSLLVISEAGLQTTQRRAMNNRDGEPAPLRHQYGTETAGRIVMVYAGVEGKPITSLEVGLSNQCRA